LKIIRLSTFLDFGGVERRLSNISYIEDENEWIFCAIGKGGKAEQIIRENQKEVICFNWDHKIPNLNTLFKLYRFLKREQPDVLHTSGAEANFFGVTAGRLAGVRRIVAEEIGIPKQGKLGRFIFNCIYRSANFVIGNSLKVLNYLETFNKVHSSKLKLIPNPLIFPDLSLKTYIYQLEFKLISVSRLEPVKNIESVLRVVAKLKKENKLIKYNILGEGILMEHLKQLVIDLDIGKEVSFYGFHSDPYPFLLQADLYLLTSFSEGFSNSLVEAMYAGIPSLSTRTGAAEEIIQDGVNGWLVEVDNDNALYLKIKNIMCLDPEQLKNIGLAGRDHVIKNYSLEQHRKQLISIYN